MQVKRVLERTPSKRRITAELTVELGRVPFGSTACRKAVRSPDALKPVAALTVSNVGRRRLERL